MKLELINSKQGTVTFRDCEKTIFPKVRKLHTCYERLYFTYNIPC